MTTCDLCNKIVDRNQLNQLSSEFAQTYKVNEVCKDCMSHISETSLKLQSLYGKVFKEFEKPIYRRLIDSLRKKKITGRYSAD